MEELVNHQITRDAQITPTEIEGLRLAVGWDPVGKYERALKASYTHFSVKKDDTLIAYARIVSDGILYAFIVDLMVHPDFQHQGLGRQLVQHVIAEVKKENIKYIQLTFDPQMESFYKECGFEILKAGSIINK